MAYPVERLCKILEDGINLRILGESPHDVVLKYGEIGGARSSTEENGLLRNDMAFQ